MRRALIVLALLAVAAPARAQDIHSFGYARLGYGGVFADDSHGAPVRSKIPSARDQDG